MPRPVIIASDPRQVKRFRKETRRFWRRWYSRRGFLDRLRIAWRVIRGKDL